MQNIPQLINNSMHLYQTRKNKQKPANLFQSTPMYTPTQVKSKPRLLQQNKDVTMV